MENDKAFNRLSGFFDQETESVNRLEGKLHDAPVPGETGARHEGANVLTARDSALRAVRENQVILLIAGVSLLGLMVAASFLLGRMSPRRL